MTVELGLFCLLLALATSFLTALLPLFGARRNNAQLMSVAVSGSLTLFALVGVAFAVLIKSFVVSDFSVRVVWENSHSLMPLLYRFTGVWGNHEGSMMLWLFILTLFSALVAAFSRNLPDTLRANVLSVQASIAFAFLLFIILTSNPFLRLSPVPGEGRELNPILQDIGLAIHPPLLYLGYVGFSVCFSFAVAALLTGRIDAAWARWVRPWALLAWVFLTAGIAMGSYWAYYELGWGGWWFWDPVENASFMPWLAATALLHSALVMEKREALKIWTILLAILTFSLSLLGTFLVRSGVLTSVHAFATDPSRGVFILAILGVFIGGSLMLFAWRAPLLKAGGLFSPISREGALVFNNLILTVSAGTVLVGTLYPLLLETLTGDKISVGAPFFNLTFGILMIPLLLAVPFGPMLSWKRGDLKAASERLLAAMVIAVVLALGFLYLHAGGPVLAVFAVGLAFFLMAGAVSDLWFRAGFGRVSLKKAWPRFTGLPRPAFGTALAHFGLGVSVLGIVVVSLYETETVLEMSPGMAVEAGGYSVSFEGAQRVVGPNYVDQQAVFEIARDGKELGHLASSKRVFMASNMPTTEAGIRTFGLSQLYVSVGDEGENGAWVVRIWWKPFILCIWLGGVFMALGGLVSLSDRRLRIGAPVRSRKTVGNMGELEKAG